ncbi:permease prefix domain 1-containing protein [Isoptericola sp. NEAU-Y5]|uniref:Permease prefix domain 1-containing protein n=1 Tax=Isoptericola luteus TaxID=2879484 RepID=A0ABS7ZJ84_9MICO|nr:permease prefix domain 1-containing protein [Isoptericola sp. NEAU-Y5]MCA5894396.1 permease prefix domain 1-containing protein [Isoptericola sp. NEAU-Y5]
MTTVHRLLDDAFAGVDLTPEVQDLKEEIRANLEARAAEIEASGVSPSDAAHQAFDELGDVSALVAEAAGAPSSTDATATPGGRPAAAARYASTAQAMLANRVRPKPGFVVGVVLGALVVVAALALAGLGAARILTLPAIVVVALLVTAASAAGFIVGFSLSQETTTNHPVPSPRAGGYYLATGLSVLGLLLALFTLLEAFPSWMYLVAGVFVVPGVVLFVGLGVTQTNRKKAWFREVSREHGVVGDRFDRDPEAAARFGIFTAVIWVSAFVACVVVGTTAGWAWSWLALVAGWIVFMLLLARMLFGEKPRTTAAPDDKG